MKPLNLKEYGENFYRAMYLSEKGKLGSEKEMKAGYAKYERTRQQEMKARLAEDERTRQEEENARIAKRNLYKHETKEDRKARKAKRAQERRQSLKDGLLNAWWFIIFIIVIGFVGLIWSTISVALFGDCGTTEQCELQQQQWEDSRR